MKKIILTVSAALALLATPPAQAWTYNNYDVLLIFRENNFNDVEFDLGNVSQFTNLPSGTTITVPNWTPSLVTGTFGANLTGVSVILAGTTSQYDANRAAWLSSVSNGVAYNLTASDWQGSLWSTISSIGTRPVTYLVPSAVTNSVAVANAYSVAPGGTYQIAAYDYIVSPNGNSIAQFGGNAGFTVEQKVPGTLGFWQIQPGSTATPAVYLGTFAITANGVLTYTAGPPPPSITGLARSGSLNTVSFATIPGVSYSLVYTNKLGGAASTWPIVSGPIIGDGAVDSLTHNSTTNAGFYRVSTP
jgi:hypothetical protein